MPAPYLREAPVIAAALERWYLRHRRALPWREDPSPYKTVVSEFMLQQTRVETVLPYFYAWMERFPGFSALAQASEAEVLKHWEGLGYYRRARNLHRLAVEIDQRGGELPGSATDWQELPGIGPYTAAAVASISHGERVAVVDGNVVRVLARLGAVDCSFSAPAAAVRFFQSDADALVEAARNPGDHNQAMMELGAMVCTRTRPQCLLCPLSTYCKAYAQGQPERFPQLERTPTQKVTVDRLWVSDTARSALLLHRIPDDAPRLAGLYELPPASLLLEQEAIAALPVVSTRQRGITRYRITEHLHETMPDPALRKAVRANPELEWVPLASLGSITLSGPHQKWLRQLLPGSSTPGQSAGQAPRDSTRRRPGGPPDR